MPGASDMADAAFIGVDWGTSNARFLLSDAEGGLIAAKSGPGVATLASPDAFEASCFDAIAGWASVPVIMAGMVGARMQCLLAAREGVVEFGLVCFELSA